MKKKRKGLRGTTHEHHERAIYDLKRDRRPQDMTCTQIGSALFRAGVTMAHAVESKNHRLYVLAAKRRDALKAQHRRCIGGR